MNQISEQIFKDGYETIKMYFVYLHLGYFYSQLSKHEDLSCKPMNTCIDYGTNKYSLSEDIIKSSLKDIHEKPHSPDVLSYLILNNTIRGVTMALFETLKDEEIKKIFLEYIFRNDDKAYNDFDGILRFIRNTFSHNIRDRIELKKRDYDKQINHLKKMGKSTLNFFFDYAESPIPLNRKNYSVKIDIDFNQIKDGVIYTDIISEYQSLLFIELCYNCMEYLSNKLDESSLDTEQMFMLYGNHSNSY